MIHAGRWINYSVITQASISGPCKDTWKTSEPNELLLGVSTQRMELGTQSAPLPLSPALRELGFCVFWNLRTRIRQEVYTFPVFVLKTGLLLGMVVNLIINLVINQDLTWLNSVNSWGLGGRWHKAQECQPASPSGRLLLLSIIVLQTTPKLSGFKTTTILLSLSWFYGLSGISRMVLLPVLLRSLSCRCIQIKPEAAVSWKFN